MSSNEKRVDKEGYPHDYDRGSSIKEDQKVYSPDGRYLGRYEDGAFYDENDQYVG
jgi:hypothetical protein